jgi:SAM-dependent methyltransferase
MTDLDVQTEYWKAVAASKTFTHPIPLSLFRDLLPTTAKILDYGCGYGRTCRELSDAGYHNVTGIDISEEMINRGKSLHGHLDLLTFDGKSPELDDCSFDACLLIAVLTCIPSDPGQERTIKEILRLLRPGGIAFVSDYPLQPDSRNRKRYQEFEKEFGTFGMFRTEGAIFRHHDMKRILQLLSPFDILYQMNIRVSTMNGHESDIFQIVAQKTR